MRRSEIYVAKNTGSGNGTEEFQRITGRNPGVSLTSMHCPDVEKN